MASPPIPGNGTQKRWTFQSLSVRNRNVHPSRRTQSQNSSNQSRGQEQALYVLLAATGMRISEAFALETHHFTNNGRTIVVEQQVEKDSAKLVKYFKTAAAKREVDLHPDIAEYLQRYTAEKNWTAVSSRRTQAASVRQSRRPLAHSTSCRDEFG